MNGRSCHLADGRPKKCFKTFDEAQDVATRALGMSASKRYTAYRCPEHGWHVGHTFSQPMRRNA